MDIVITGANRGLGLALCTIFSEKKHRVFALYRNKGDALLQASKAFSENGSLGSIIPIQCDVTEELQIQHTYEVISAISPSIDILINNAAVHLEQDKPDLEELDFSVYLPTFAVNSVAPLMVVRGFLPLLRKGAVKCIICISSEAGSIENCQRDREYAYCMSKSALNMAMRILHNRLKREQFRIRLIHPGWVRTDMGGNQASLSPSESASSVYNQIIKTLQNPPTSKEPLYIDWEGQPLPW